MFLILLILILFFCLRLNNWLNTWLEIWALLWKPSLFDNTSPKHERHKCDTSDTNATWMQHEWETSETQVLHERHQCDMSAKPLKKLILITTRVKTYFHTPIFTIWQVKDYKGRNNFIVRITKCPVPMPKYVCENAQQKMNFVITKVISKKYILQSVTRYLRLTLVWNGALPERFYLCFF